MNFVIRDFCLQSDSQKSKCWMATRSVFSSVSPPNTRPLFRVPWYVWQDFQVLSLALLNHPLIYLFKSSMFQTFLYNGTKMPLLDLRPTPRSWKITTPFCVVTRPVVVISYRRFGATRGSHLQGSRIQKKGFFHFFWGGFLTPENGTVRLSRNVFKKLPLLAA